MISGVFTPQDERLYRYKWWELLVWTKQPTDTSQISSISINIFTNTDSIGLDSLI